MLFMWTCGRTILSPPEQKVDEEQLKALPPLPRDEEGPVFAEPWQAQAFALAVKLSEQGHFTWKEWATALAEELKTAEAQGKPDDGSQYYHHWVTVLERLVTEKGLSNSPRSHQLDVVHARDSGAAIRRAHAGVTRYG